MYFIDSDVYRQRIIVGQYAGNCNPIKAFTVQFSLMETVVNLF